MKQTLVKWLSDVCTNARLIATLSLSLCFYAFSLPFNVLYRFFVHIQDLERSLPQKTRLLNASSVVPPVIPLLHDIARRHCVTYLHNGT